jgi:phage shock protein PspC (stress-responsive transcriptional regulator)
MMSTFDELERLQKLKDAGTINEEEFKTLKAQIFVKSDPVTDDVDQEDEDEENYSHPQIIDSRYHSLYCSSDEKVILGLCGGIAHKTGMPIAAVRFIAFISLFVFVGWLYFVGLFLPKLPTKFISRSKR